MRLRPAPGSRYLPDLIDLVFDGTTDPGKVFDLTLPLDPVAEGCHATTTSVTARSASESPALEQRRCPARPWLPGILASTPTTRWPGDL